MVAYGLVSTVDQVERGEFIAAYESPVTRLKCYRRQRNWYDDCSSSPYHAFNTMWHTSQVNCLKILDAADIINCSNLLNISLKVISILHASHRDIFSFVKGRKLKKNKKGGELKAVVCRTIYRTDSNFFYRYFC